MEASRRPPTRLTSALGRYVSPSPMSLKLESKSTDQCCLPGSELGSRGVTYRRPPGPELGSRGVTYRRPPSPESACAQDIRVRQFQVYNWDGFLPQSPSYKINHLNIKSLL